ncbi:Flp1 family type IVb pilin [Anaerovorax odorimutans]|uniref:Flp1 family type IVb pilin n=1 Tax=Anaerovorax odorimutans TaxID=109327 RepID=UPI00041E7CB3|nr:Flp1 family type IVb pilin [Anaerovorax odorimutans]
MKRIIKIKNNKKGMELVQVAILIAIAIGLGLIFKDKIGEFVNSTFDNLLNSDF